MKEFKSFNEAARKFDNGIVIINTTPHPLTIENLNGELVSVPTSVLINANAASVDVGPFFCKTEFSSTTEGTETIASIKDWFANTYTNGETLVIIGSMIAAQAYKGQVFGLVPVPGFERVAPAEKRMRCDKFTTFA